MAKDGTVVAELHSTSPNAHSSLLPTFVEQLFQQAALTPRDLQAVCVSSGPGSYTGLRIGVSTAKGFAYALGIPLLSVPTLQAMASGYFESHADFQGAVCPMLDARRMECYTAIYNRDLSPLRTIGADIIEEHIYDAWLDRMPIVFIGDGAAKTQQVLGIHPNACFDDAFAVSASYLLPLAMQHLQAGQIEDVAYFEPFYLKDFVAKKPVVKGLR